MVGVSPLHALSRSLHPRPSSLGFMDLATLVHCVPDPGSSSSWPFSPPPSRRPSSGSSGDQAGYALGRVLGPALRSGRLGSCIGHYRWEPAEEMVARRGIAVFGARRIDVLRAAGPAGVGSIGVAKTHFPTVQGGGSGRPWRRRDRGGPVRGGRRTCHLPRVSRSDLGGRDR
jgi:hypothetical protein